MTTLADLRQKYPVFKDKGDFDIVKMLSEEMQQPLDYTAYQLGLPPGDYVQNTGFGGDTATDLAVGASQIPGTIAGLADLANPFAYIPETNNLTLSKGVDWAEQQMGLTDWRNRQQAMLSPERQAQDQAIRDKFAEGDVAGGAWEAVTSPRSFAGAAIQSVPLSLLGGALGRGVGAAADVAKLARLKKVAPWVGEGAVSTGAQVDQLTQQGVDPGTANLAGLAAGAGVGALGGSLGMAGRAVGIDDVEAWLGGAGRLAEGTKPVSLIPRIGGSAALETLQEMPQSAWEQVTQNVATGDPLGKDVAYQTIMGGLSGAAMGGAFGVMPRGYKPETPPPPASEDTQAPPPPPPPAPDLNQAAPPAPTPPASKPAAPGVSPDQLSEFERGLLGSLGSHPGNPDFTALNPDGTVKGWVVDALHQASTNTPEQLKRKINSKSGIILKPLWEAALAEKQKLKAAPPTPTTNAPEYSDNEKALIGLVSPEQYRKSDHKLNGLAEKAVRKIASLSLDDLRDAQGKKIPTWHIPLYEHMIAVREAEQKQANPESPAGQTSQEADLKTSQNPTQEAAPTPPVVATQEPTPTPIEVPDAQAVPPTPQASQTPSRPEVPAPAAPTDLRPSPDAAQQAEMEARRARFEQRKREAQAAADAQAATLETLATRKVVVDDSAPGWQDRLNAAIDKVATERGFDAKTRATFSEMVQRFYQVGRFNTYSGISEPPSYDAMAGRMTRDGHPVSHTTMGLLLNEFQKNYVEGLSADNITPTFENTKAEAVGMPHDSGNYRGKKNTGATSAAEDYVDLSANRSENVATVAKDINDLGPERLDVSMPLNPNSGMDATAEDTVDAKYAQDSIETDNPDADLGYTTGAIGNAETAAQGGSGGGNVSSRPKVTAYFKSRYRFAANAERAKAGQAPITEQEITKELGKLDDIVLGRYFDRVVRSGVSDKRMADPKDPKPKLLDAYQALQEDIKALGENAFRNTKNNRTVNDLPNPDTSIAVPGAISAWDKAVVGMPGAVHIGKLPAELASEWENVYNQTLHLPDIHRAPALKKFARSLIDDYNARGSVRTSGQDTQPTSQPQGSEQGKTGTSPDNAGRLAESGNAQPGLAEERGQATPPEVVVGDKSLAGVQVKSKLKRRIVKPEVQQGRDTAEVSNPTTKEQFEKAVSSVLSKGSNWRLHVYQNLDEAVADTAFGSTPREIGTAYGWAKDIKGVKHAFFILDRVQKGTELGKFLHEVGAHLGIENILTKAELNNLYDKIKEWALQADTSLESQIAMAAMARVEAAQQAREKTGRESDQYTMDDIVRETLAYFVESAVTEFGVDPFALQATTALGSWFRRLWNGFKRALRKVRLTNLDTLEPQHLVDLAYGAARLELNYAPSLENISNSLLRNRKRISDLLNRLASNKTRFSSLKVPANRLVLTDVFSTGHDRQVFDAIIQAIPIEMMDVLAARELSPEVLFHDRAVLFDLFAVNGDKPIAFGADVADAFVRTVAGVTAKSITSPTHKTDTPLKTNSAVGAGVGSSGLSLRAHGGSITKGGFNDKNIFRVANAVGGDTSPGNVQYGFNAPEHLTAIQSAVSDKIKDTYSHTTKRGILGWMSIGQIADRFGKDLPMVKVISKTMDEMSAQSKHWLDKADHTVRMWGLLTPKQKELLHKIMAQATLNEYDPEMSNSIPTKPVEKQIDQMWTQLKALDVNAKVKAVNVYRAARQCFRDDLAEADAFLAKLQSKATGKQATSLNHLIAAIKTLSKNRKGVYFPLLRVGDFYSVGMSPKLFALHEKKLAAEDGGQALNPGEQVLYDKMRLDKKQYMVEGHKSEAQAAKAVARYESQGMVAASNVKRFVSSKARAAITPEMERFQKILSDLDVPDSIAGSLEQAYEHLLINNLPEGHALKQQLHREGIYGWHEDMMQSFAKAAQSRAFALSRLLHVRDLQEQMGELDAYSAFGRNPPEKAQMARDVLNELKRQQDLAYTRTSDPVLVRFATGWNYYAMLGASPAFWLLNLSQVPVITLPWLAARNKNQYGTTIKALAKGAKQVYQMISVGFENGELRSELDPTRNVPGISAEEKQLLTGLKDRGKLEFTIGMDTGAIGEGEYGAISKLKRSLNTPTNVTELINRGSTALAAYRISRANHHTHEQAVEFAVEAIDKTHMNYDPATTARNLKTIMGIPGTQAFAKIAFQFWKFQQGMAYLTLSTMKDAFNSPDPVVRKQARDTAIGMTITLTTTAGAFGLPFVGWGLGLLTQLFKAGPDDRDPDAERMLKNWIHDYLPWAEDYLTKGLWGLLPQGANPDFSNRFSTANLMNPLAYARYDNTARGEDVVKETLFRTFGGATATNAGAVYDGIKAMLDGDMLKATEKLVPLKFLRDLAKAAELQTKGLQTGTGEQRLNPGDFTAMDEIWQLMGVTPMKKSLYYDRTKAVNDAMQAVNDVRTKLMSEYGQARMHGGDVSKIMQEVTKFNIRNPQAKITMENLKQAYQRRQKNQQNTDEFGVLLDKRTKPYASNARWAS